MVTWCEYVCEPESLNVHGCASTKKVMVAMVIGVLTSIVVVGSAESVILRTRGSCRLVRVAVATPVPGNGAAQVGSVRAGEGLARA